MKPEIPSLPNYEVSSLPTGEGFSDYQVAAASRKSAPISSNKKGRSLQERLSDGLFFILFRLWRKFADIRHKLVGRFVGETVPGFQHFAIFVNQQRIGKFTASVVFVGQGII